jgi:hypothetical protein
LYARGVLLRVQHCLSLIFFFYIAITILIILQHHVQPIVIFFGALSSASAWLTDMEASGSSCSLPVLLDEQRAIYGRFGLRRSRSGKTQPFTPGRDLTNSNTFPAVFAFDCLALYADELLQARCRTLISLPSMKPQTRNNLQGRALPKGAGGVAEDVLQMGGDFVVARDGR